MSGKYPEVHLQGWADAVQSSPLPPPHVYLSHNVPNTSASDWSRYATPPLIAQLVCIMIQRLDAQAIRLRGHRLLPLKSYHRGRQA